MLPTQSGDASEVLEDLAGRWRNMFLSVECECGFCISLSDKPDPEWYLTGLYVGEQHFVPNLLYKYRNLKYMKVFLRPSFYFLTALQAIVIIVEL